MPFKRPEHGINNLQLARLTHSDQQFCIFVETHRWRVSISQHLRPSFDCSGNVINGDARIEIRSKRIKTTGLVWGRDGGVLNGKIPDGVISNVVRIRPEPKGGVERTVS